MVGLCIKAGDDHTYVFFLFEPGIRRNKQAQSTYRQVESRQKTACQAAGRPCCLQSTLVHYVTDTEHVDGSRPRLGTWNDFRTLIGGSD